MRNEFHIALFRFHILSFLPKQTASLSGRSFSTPCGGAINCLHQSGEHELCRHGRRALPLFGFRPHVAAHVLAASESHFARIGRQTTCFLRAANVACSSPPIFGESWTRTTLRFLCRGPPSRQKAGCSREPATPGTGRRCTFNRSWSNLEKAFSTFPVAGYAIQGNPYRRRRERACGYGNVRPEGSIPFVQDEDNAYHGRWARN